MSEVKNDYNTPAVSQEPENEGAYERGIYKPGFHFKANALKFFRMCVGNEIYEQAMSSEVGKHHHYVVARVFLNQADWEKFVWIEEHGSLDGFFDCCS